MFFDANNWYKYNQYGQKTFQKHFFGPAIKSELCIPALEEGSSKCKIISKSVTSFMDDPLTRK